MSVWSKPAILMQTKTRLPLLFFHSLKGTSKPNSFSSLQNRGPIPSLLSLSLFAKLQIHFYRIETEYKTHYQESEILERERKERPRKGEELSFIFHFISFFFHIYLMVMMVMMALLSWEVAKHLCQFCLRQQRI